MIIPDIDQPVECIAIGTLASKERKEKAEITRG